MPVFKIVRFPQKLMVPAALAIAQLAAMGLDRLIARDPSREDKEARWLPALLAVSALWFALYAFALLAPSAAHKAAEWLAAYTFDAAVAARLRFLLELEHSEIVARAASWLVAQVRATFLMAFASTLLIALALHPALPFLARRRMALAAALVGVAQLVAPHYGLNPVVSPRFYSERPPALRHAEARGVAPLRIFAEPLRS